MKTTTRELTELSMDELSMVAGGDGDTYSIGDGDGEGNVVVYDPNAPGGMSWRSLADMDW